MRGSDSGHKLSKKSSADDVKNGRLATEERRGRTVWLVERGKGASLEK